MVNLQGGLFFDRSRYLRAVERPDHIHAEAEFIFNHGALGEGSRSLRERLNEAYGVLSMLRRPCSVSFTGNYPRAVRSKYHAPGVVDEPEKKLFQCAHFRKRAT